jgi:hypothetical protein
LDAYRRRKVRMSVHWLPTTSVTSIYVTAQPEQS